MVRSNIGWIERLGDQIRLPAIYYRLVNYFGTCTGTIIAIVPMYSRYENLSMDIMYQINSLLHFIVIMLSSNNNNNNNSFQPTVDSLEQALRVMVERNIELETMLQNKPLLIRDTTTTTRLHESLQQLIAFLRKSIEDSHHIESQVKDSPLLCAESHISEVWMTRRNMTKFMADFDELLVEFLKEVQHSPHDRIKDNCEQLLPNNDYISRKDVTWFVQELMVRFGQLRNLFCSERDMMKTWILELVNSINNIEKHISDEQILYSNRTDVGEIDLDPCRNERNELLQDKQLYIASLEGIIISLQDELSRRDSKKMYQQEIPQSRRENLDTEFTQLKLLFEKEHQLPELRKKNFLLQTMSIPYPTDDYTTTYSTEGEQSTRSPIYVSLRREIQLLQQEKLELEQKLTRILDGKTISDRNQQFQEEATKIKLMYLQQMVKDLGMKTPSQQDSFSTSYHGLGFLETLKDYDNGAADDDKMHVSLLSPKPKFFSFTKLSTTPKDINRYSHG